MGSSSDPVDWMDEYCVPEFAWSPKCLSGKDTLEKRPIGLGHIYVARSIVRLPGAE